MKKNKTIAYMLAATLLVGGTFVGTKALFTDVENVVTELQISTGDVDIIEVDNGPTAWELDRNGAEILDRTNVNVVVGDTIDGNLPQGEDKFDITQEAFANNLKPGDKLTKTVTIKNNGTLVATKISVTENPEAIGNLNDLFEVSYEGLESTELLPGEETTFKLKLTVKDINSVHDKEENSTEWNSDAKEDTSFELTNGWILRAEQQS